MAVNVVEIYYGTPLIVGSVTIMGGTGALGLAGAAPTGGISVAVTAPAIAVEVVPLITGTALVAHGFTGLMFSASRNIDSLPTIQRKGLLGQDGTNTDGSQTLWKGKRGRLDVENLSPGFREGSIHFQPWSNSKIKFQYNPYDRTFLPSGNIPVPKYLNRLLYNDSKFIQKIIHGLRILGEIK